ncbi:MAG: hypothetical protein CMJ54_00165 [Planctomycetaceae bacterium]|nr:hypothetical protein [Planctomycetaceae bacterium]
MLIAEASMTIRAYTAAAESCDAAYSNGVEPARVKPTPAIPSLRQSEAIAPVANSRSRHAHAARCSGPRRRSVARRLPVITAQSTTRSMAGNTTADGLEPSASITETTTTVPVASRLTRSPRSSPYTARREKKPASDSARWIT